MCTRSHLYIRRAKNLTSYPFVPYSQNNNLTELPRGAFTGLETLTNLALFDNSIKNISDYAFEGLYGLVQLCLQENELVHLSSRAFKGTFALSYLWLDSNNLKSISPGVWEDVKYYIETIGLADNNLTCEEVSQERTRAMQLFNVTKPTNSTCGTHQVQEKMQEKNLRRMAEHVDCYDRTEDAPKNVRRKGWAAVCFLENN